MFRNHYKYCYVYNYLAEILIKIAASAVFVSGIIVNYAIYYVCVLVGIRFFSDPVPIYSYGEIHGKVSLTSSGEGGFGYDKIFYPYNYDISMATMESEVKNSISHRAIAAKSFLDELKKINT